MSITKSKKNRHRKVSGSAASNRRPKTTGTEFKQPHNSRRLRLDACHEDALDPILEAEIGGFFRKNEIVDIGEYSNLEKVLPQKRHDNSKGPKKLPCTDVSSELSSLPLSAPLEPLSESKTELVEPSSPLRKKVTRRRQIDPTTCERNYSSDEVEFMTALDEYKRKSGRMFPTCSEILEVLKSLGYSKPTHQTHETHDVTENDTTTGNELPQSTIPFVSPLVAIHG